MQSLITRETRKKDHRSRHFSVELNLIPNKYGLGKTEKNGYENYILNLVHGGNRKPECRNVLCVYMEPVL